MNKIYLLISVLTIQILNANLIDNFLHIDFNKDSSNNLLLDKKFDHNYIDKARINIEHSHFSDVERDYTIRLYTKSFSQVDNEEKIYNLNKKLYQEEIYLQKMDLIKDRYKVLIETMYQNRLLHVLLEEMNFKQNSLDMKKNLLEKESDIITLYEIKKSINNIELAQLKEQRKYQKLLYKIQRILKIENLFTIRREINQHIFLDPYKIMDYINQNIGSFPKSNINIFSKSNISKLELAKEKMRSENIKQKMKLDNIEMKFDDSKKSKNALSVGLSIEIPMAKNSTNILKEQLKIFNIQNKIEKIESNLNDKIIELTQDIKSLINYFKKVDIQKSKINIKNKKNSYPIKFLLSIKKQHLKFEKEKTKTLYQILNKYVTLLYLTNQLETSDFKDILKNKRVY